MKVALLSDCYPPRTGGIESQVGDLAAQLARRGHDVEVLTATPGAGGERDGAVEIVDGVRVHRLAVRFSGEIPVNPLASCRPSAGTWLGWRRLWGCRPR